MRIALEQFTPEDASLGGSGLFVEDLGPVNHEFGLRLTNDLSSAPAIAALELDGSYDNVVTNTFRPPSGGALYFTFGGEVSGTTPTPYFIFEDNGATGSIPTNKGGSIEFTPLTGQFLFAANGSNPGITAPSLTSTTAVTTPGILPNTIYSVAGTVLPTCNSGLKGMELVVSDATSPTYLGTYAGSGAVTTPVLCNGTNWVTY
jgi:hypothetical protein